jgi:hypothetical protein
MLLLAAKAKVMGQRRTAESARAVAGAASVLWAVGGRRRRRYYCVKLGEVPFLANVTGLNIIAPLPGPADWIIPPGAKGPLRRLQAQDMALLLAHCVPLWFDVMRSGRGHFGSRWNQTMPPHAA